VTETPNPNIVDTDTLTGEMHSIRRCVLSIGSNLGERLNNLQGAVNSLADTPEVWLTAVSPVYETAPVGAPEGSHRFLNAVVMLDTTLSARMLLERALAIEDAYGRERTGESGAPRTLDIDLVLVGDRRAEDSDLALPHPRAHERAFVLAPWHALDAEAELPGAGPVAVLLERVGGQDVRVREDLTLTLQ
jgi:2-amino-4-hydroxy-6-hydroxymethyldihydropteridine diphosphokinase